MGRIIVNLDVEMAKRKMSLSELAERVGLTLANLSILKTGKAKAVRFTTLEAICRELGCQPGDILDTEMSKLIKSQHYGKRYGNDRDEGATALRSAQPKTGKIDRQCVALRRYTATFAICEYRDWRI